MADFFAEEEVALEALTGGAFFAAAAAAAAAAASSSSAFLLMVSFLLAIICSVARAFFDDRSFIVSLRFSTPRARAAADGPPPLFGGGESREAIESGCAPVDFLALLEEDAAPSAAADDRPIFPEMKLSRLCCAPPVALLAALDAAVGFLVAAAAGGSGVGDRAGARTGDEQ